MKVEIDGIYFFINSLHSLHAYFNKFPELANKLMDLVIEDSSLFSSVEYAQLKYFAVRFPQHKKRYFEHLLNSNLFANPTSNTTLKAILFREKEIDRYLELFPDFAKQLIEKRTPESILLQNSPQNVDELNCLITKYPSRKEEFINKILQEKFNDFFRNLDTIDQFMKDFPDHRSILIKKLFEPNGENWDIVWGLCKNSPSPGLRFVRLLETFKDQQEKLYDLLLEHFHELINHYLDFSTVWVNASSIFQKKLLEKAFADSENFQRLIHNEVSLESYSNLIKEPLVPYLRKLLDLPLLWRNYLTQGFCQNSLHKTCPNFFFKEIIPFVFNQQSIFTMLFKKAYDLYNPSFKRILPDEVMEDFLGRAFELNDPVNFFKSQGYCIAHLGKVAPRNTEKLIKILLKKDSDFFKVFNNFNEIKDCIRAFPDYKEDLLRQLTKKERPFSKLMSNQLDLEYGLISARRTFPDYSLFQVKDPVKKIKENYERLDTWAKVSKHPQNPYRKHLSQQSIHLIAMFAVDNEVYNAKTASEVTQEILNSESETPTP